MARVHAARTSLPLLLDAAALLAVSVEGQGCSLKFGASLLKTFRRLLEFGEAEISRLSLKSELEIFFLQPVLCVQGASTNVA